MTALDWVVAAMGIAAIAWVNWYFFLAERRAAPAKGMNVKGGGARGSRGGRDDANDTIDNGK
ncbi:MAG TPA: hypothetical protein VFT57_14840 [Gemmatimonadaceae bacterium]|nr:hypothetical protein [Gemmatimonadaceae bacterium]